MHVICSAGVHGKEGSEQCLSPGGECHSGNAPLGESGGPVPGYTGSGECLLKHSALSSTQTLKPTVISFSLAHPGSSAVKINSFLIAHESSDLPHIIV